MTELKPCPFCGSRDVESWGKYWVVVVCLACGARGPSEVGAAAIAAWNERSDNAN